MAQTHLPPQFAERVLANLNAHGWDSGQFPHQSIRLLTAWCRAEGGNAEWDPLNATTHITAAGIQLQGPDYNAAHVANYVKATYGVVGTVLTLLNGNYNGIVGFLQAPAITAEQAVSKYGAQFRLWGTDTRVLLEVLAETP